MKTLREILREKGIKQQVVADALGITVSVMGRYDNLRRRSMDEVESIEKATGIPMEELIGRKLADPVNIEVGTASGAVGQINGGICNIHNGSPEEVKSEVHREQVEKSFDVLRVELSRFHDKLDHKDRYISRILQRSYLRNEAHLKRIDGLISTIVELSRSIQERADAIAGSLKNDYEK